MKQVWNVFVFLGYIYGTDKLLLTRAEVRTLDLSSGENSDIKCADNLAIRIDNVTVHAHQCVTNMTNACVLSYEDYKLIETRCNNTNKCIVEYPKKTSCLKDDRYFNLSYSCLAPRNLLCTFEFSFCDWENMSGDLHWERYSTNRSSTTISDIPTMDHTTKSQNGFHIYLKKQMSAKTAILTSRLLSFNIEKCLVLRYKMDSRSKLVIYKNSSTSTPFCQTGNATGDFWGIASIPLYQGKSSKIVIEGIVDEKSNAYIAIDDIDIQDWKCNEEFPLSCNFEANDLCSFKLQPTFDLRWELSLAEADKEGRPLIDHTNDRYGYYIYARTLNHNVTHRRRIIIPFKSELEGCLTLWYYLYGDRPGHLYIYMNNTEEILSYIVDTKTTAWSRFQANVYNANQIILEYNITSANRGGIALDDIYISPNTCSVEESHSQECIKKDTKLHMTCPVSNVVIEALAFDPNISLSCGNTTEQIQDNLDKIFGQCKHTASCTFTPADLIDDECFNISKRLQLTYSCIAPLFPGPTENQTISTSPQTDEMSTAVTKRTQTTMSHTFGLTDTTFFTTMDKQTISTSQHTGDNSVQSNSSTPVIGIVVGVVLSLITLSVFLVIAVIYFKRYRYTEKKGHSIVANEDSHSDYTGHQNTAFSKEVNVTTHTDYCEIRKSKLNEHYHDISDTFSPSINTTDDEYSEIANVVNSPNNNQNASTNYQHQYISLDPNATGFDRSNQQTTLFNESKNKHNLNETTSFTGGDDYAILDPDNLNESTNNTPKVLPLSENYVVLDPNETGFNRQENSDTVCNYELATPINPTETSEDPYDVSKEETYDTSSNSRHKEKDNNIYSHMVDNVYDTAGNQRNKEDNDGTYDHFFGQQSEDDYDISKPL